MFDAFPDKWIITILLITRASARHRPDHTMSVTTVYGRDAPLWSSWLLVVLYALPKSCVFTKCNEYRAQNQLPPTAVLCGYVDKATQRVVCERVNDY